MSLLAGPDPGVVVRMRVTDLQWVGPPRLATSCLQTQQPLVNHSLSETRSGGLLALLLGTVGTVFRVWGPAVTGGGVSQRHRPPNLDAEPHGQSIERQGHAAGGAALASCSVSGAQLPGPGPGGRDPKDATWA